MVMMIMMMINSGDMCTAADWLTWLANLREEKVISHRELADFANR